MFVIVCGMPWSGKSAAVDILFPRDTTEMFIDGNCIIRPEEWIPKNIEAMGPDAEKNYRVTVWQMAMEKTDEALGDVDISCAVVLDQGNHKFHTVEQLIRKAKSIGHEVVLLYISAKLPACQERAGDRWFGRGIWDDCVEHLKISLPKYKSVCDRFLVLNNHGSLEELTQLAYSCDLEAHCA